MGNSSTYPKLPQLWRCSLYLFLFVWKDAKAFTQINNWRLERTHSMFSFTAWTKYPIKYISVILKLYLFVFQYCCCLSADAEGRKEYRHPGVGRPKLLARPLGFLYFVPALLLSIFTIFALRTSSVSLSYFILAVPVPTCWGEHSCMSSTFFIAMLK